MFSYILAVLTGVATFVGDLITKKYIVANFELYDTREFIPGLIDLHYIHNTGAAWGILEGKTWLLLVFTFAVMALCIGYLIKTKNKSRLLFWAIALVISGGLGNMCDRIFRDGKVVDFLHFEFFPTFPVFNIADCAIVVGSGLLMLYFIIDTVKEYKNKKQDKDADI